MVEHWHLPPGGALTIMCKCPSSGMSENIFDRLARENNSFEDECLEFLFGIFISGDGDFPEIR